MTRGDIVTCSFKGDYGKTRPAVVVQSDLFNLTHSSITLCPITSLCLDTPLFRIVIAPSKETGLEKQSQIMVDKIMSVKTTNIKATIGRLALQDLIKLNDKLKLWLGIM